MPNPRAPKSNPFAAEEQPIDPNAVYNQSIDLAKKAAEGEDIGEIVDQAAQQVVADIGRKYALVPIEAIRPNPLGNPRLTMDQAKLQSLANSIREDGLLEPVILRRSSDPGVYELVAGERRWRAATLAGLEAIPAEILEECSDSKMRRIALIENLLREQLTHYELALAYDALLDERDEQGKKVYTTRSLAEAIHQARDHVDSHLAILRVPEEVRQLIVDDDTIPLRIVREVGGVEDPADRALLIKEVRDRSLKQADIIAILQENKQGKKRKLKEVLAEEESKPEPVSPIARAIFLRKFQAEHTQFSKSISRVAQEWRQIDVEARREVHNQLRERIRIMEELLESHPVDLSV